MMPPETVRARRAEIDAVEKEIRLQQDDLKDLRRALQRRCAHPKEDRKVYTVMGDLTSDCADCGKGFY